MAHACSAADRKECYQACTGCCGDTLPECLGWAFSGECEKNVTPASRHLAATATTCAQCNRRV